MRIDYEMISRLLNAAEQVFPETLQFKDIIKAAFGEQNEVDEEKEKAFKYNIGYLAESNFITKGGALGRRGMPVYIKITPSGIDYLTSDGGLSAYLKTITVKFDLDNLRKIVAEGILSSGLPQEKETLLRKALKTAPEAVIKTITTTLIQKALKDPVESVKILANALGISI